MKYLRIALLLLVITPSVTHAAWWNFFSWKKSPGTNATTTLVTIDASIIDDLKNRIVELENQLNNERANKEALTAQVLTKEKESVKVTPKVAVAVAPVVGGSALSEKEILAKVGPSMVSINATSTSVGSIIDARGYILTSAHAVWSQDDTGITGAAKQFNITLADGTRKKANLIGIDEAHDVAVLQIVGGGSYPYLKLNYDSGISVGDKVYVFGNGSNFVSGNVSKKSTAVEVSTDNKSSDNGGALVTGNGALIGIPNSPVCKVLEEMKTCLKYTVTSNSIKTVVPKLLAGMKLYKQKKGSTEQEILVRGQLEAVYRNTNTSSLLDYATTVVAGKNSFDYFNSKLGEDQEGKITKIYLNKLKSTAETMYSAVDFLKTQAYNLNIFFINESSTIGNLDEYERKILKEIQTFNEKRLAEYQAKVTYWSAKKNEYDGYITKPSDINHDYLMEQGVFLESNTSYFIKERSAILDLFSGENINIF